MTLGLLLFVASIAPRASASRDCEARLVPRPFEVALRGTLRESARAIGGPTWCVYDAALDEKTVLEAGDRIFILDEDERPRAEGTLEFENGVAKASSLAGLRPLPVVRPRLRDPSGGFVGGDVVRAAIANETPILAMKTCDEATRARWAPEHRRDVEIGDREFALKPDEFLVTGELRVTFADDMRHAIDFTTTGFAPARSHQGLLVGVGDEATGFAPLIDGDLVILLDRSERILVHRRVEDVARKIAAPFNDEQRAWARALARTRRVVVVRRK